jgi:hypothetical protein
VHQEKDSYVAKECCGLLQKRPFQFRYWVYLPIYTEGFESAIPFNKLNQTNLILILASHVSWYFSDYQKSLKYNYSNDNIHIFKRYN